MSAGLPPFGGLPNSVVAKRPWLMLSTLGSDQRDHCQGRSVFGDQL